MVAQHKAIIFNDNLMSFLSAAKLGSTISETTIPMVVYNMDLNYEQHSKMLRHQAVVLRLSIPVFAQNSYYC